MKKLFVTICIVIISLALQAQSQKYQNRQLALIGFSYDINKEIKPDFDKFADQFPEPENRKADRIIAKAKEYTWYMLKARLEQETGMYILPLSSHGRSFKYDEYNFPDNSISRALKKGNSRYYMRVDFSISSGIPKGEMGYGAEATTDTSALKGVGIENACLPIINIEVTIYNDKGIIPIQKLSGKAKAETPWEMGPSIFNGLINKKEFNREGTDTLLGLTNCAISKLLKQF